MSQQEAQQCAGSTADGRLTQEEAAAALRSLPRGKSPGTDGLTYEVYSAFWADISDWMIAAFNSVFLDSTQAQPQLSTSQRLGLITLIYKGGGKPRQLPDSYRPITLLNCDLKIVAKAMVMRWGPVLPSVIDTTQTAFVPGRQITDNRSLPPGGGVTCSIRAVAD